MSVFLAFVAGTGLSLAGVYFPASAWLAGIAISIRLFFNYRLWAVLAMVLGAILASARPPASGAIPSGETVLRGYFATEAESIEGGYAQRFVSLDTEGEITVLYSGKPFETGSRHELGLTVLEPEPSGNPGLMRSGEPIALYESHKELDGIEHTPAVMLNRLRAGLSDAMAASMPAPEGSLAISVTTGERSGLPDGVRTDFQRTGLTHLLSISGAHFGFFGVFLFGILRWMVVRLPRQMLERLAERITPSEAVALMSFPFMLGYLGISGASVPTVRAFVVMGLFLLGLVLGRRGQWFEFLAVAAFVVLLWDPHAMAGLSFQLSFLAVLFIGFLVRDRVKPKPDDETEEEPRGLTVRALRSAWALVLVTLAATLGTLPLVAYHFHTVSLISPLANFFVTPLVGMVVVPLSLLGAVGYFLTGTFFTAPLVGKASALALWMAHAFAEPPWAAFDMPAFPSVLIALYYAGFLLWFRDKSSWKPLVVLVAAPLVIYLALAAMDAGKSRESMRVAFLDTGWSDAAVAELPGGRVLVIDTGRKGREAAAYLRYRGISHIDALVLTHPHGDHAGGAGRILREFEVSELWDAGEGGYPSDWALPDARRVLERGDALAYDGVEILALHPYDEFASSSRVSENTEDNNRSLVLRLSGGGASFLFTGDIETDAVMSLMAVPSKWLWSDVLKLPHHGHRQDDAHALIFGTQPSHVVVTAGRLRERLGRELLPYEGMATHVTGEHGAVKFTAYEGRLEASHYSDAILERKPSLQGEWRNCARLMSAW